MTNGQTGRLRSASESALGGRTSLCAAVAMRAWPALIALALSATPLGSSAGEFAVSPLRLSLTPIARTSAFTVRNDDTTPLSFQVRGMAWTQDAQAIDRYEPATDLIYFPRLLTLAPGQEGVIRVGARPDNFAVEKTYRLFIEELAATKTPSSDTPQVRLLVRFGAPIFVKPAQSVRSLRIQGISRSAGALAWTVRNAGNAHELFREMRVEALDAAGAVVAAHLVAARYLLAGSGQSFSVALEPGQCDRIARISVSATTEDLQTHRETTAADVPCP